MALPEAYLKERQVLDRLVLEDEPKDIVQFCADFFLRRLAGERKAFLGSAVAVADPPGPAPTNTAMAFTSPFGANANPFGGGDGSPPAAPGGPAMQSVAEEEENDAVTSPTTPHFPVNFALGAKTGFRPPFNADVTSDAFLVGGRTSPNPEGWPDKYNFGRRTSVSAESLKPSADTNDNWSPPHHEKNPEQLDRLRTAIEENFLFKHLDEEMSAQVLGALVEKPIPAKDIKVIIQGDAGDFFYIVEKGTFDIYIHQSGSLQPGPDGMGKKVARISAGGSFGELALMYNAPRAATVVSAEAQCTLWALDRITFRRILMESAFARRRLYESFLEEVPLLSTLTPYERSKIADALETQKYSAGDVIIREGEPGYTFYLLVSGEADVYKGEFTNAILHYSKGDFFGELALLNDTPRAASVVAATDVKVASLAKNAFQRLLGPLEGILRRTRYEGDKTGVEEMDPLAATE